QAQSKLNYLAYHDPLTGLSNRRSFIERLDESLRESARRNERLAVLFIDLDQFKQVNDSLGHGVGDELLVAVAARLSEHVRLIDMLARLGGDEFICLMEGVRGEDDVEILAREIIGAFEYPFKLDDHELFLTASVGICLAPGDGNSVLDLMRNADTAMYRAKALGRGNFHFYTPEMTRDAQERIRMENLLRRALDGGELSVHLQPQVETRSGRLVGAEALVRWNSPELGLVMPMRFIPLAEDSGLIVGLGNWVLRETCRLVMQWRNSGFDLPQVSVNLSAKQLERPEFIEVLSQILDETGMDAARLKLELTESVVMAVGDAFDLLERLRDLGISLSLDDFGTGYSSLSYLKMLPVQQLKIDKSFIDGISNNSGDEAIIRTVMELARSLDFEVVAEGVETVEQSEFLAALGCEQLQGHLHGKAVSPAEFRARWSVRL
ncbi:MAG: EAL domain-containing protein, partial [Azonexus sp.]|nr:EAL domain-containing protein [Azonexus sp.]